MGTGASSMSFQHNLCDLRVLSGEYVTAIRARRTSPSTIPGSFGMAGLWNRDRPTGPRNLGGLGYHLHRH